MRKTTQSIGAILVICCGILLCGCGLMEERRADRLRRRVKVTQACIALLNTAIEVYRIDCERYPASLDSLLEDDGAPGWRGPYIMGGSEVLEDAWGTVFNYEVDHRVVVIRSAGPDREIDTDDDIVGEK